MGVAGTCERDKDMGNYLHELEMQFRRVYVGNCFFRVTDFGDRRET